MKRILCLVIAVAFIAVSGFGQELRFSGFMNYGVGIEFRDDDDYDPQIRVFGVDSEQAGGRFRLNGAYSNEARTVGADLRFQLQGTGNNRNTQDLGLVFAYGWVRPFEMLLIKAGLVSDSTFETAGPILRDDAGGGAGAGIFVKLTPIENLDIGFGAYPRSANSGSNNNRIESIGAEMDLADAKYTFGLAYTMPEMFKINTSFRTLNSAGIDTRYSAKFIGELQILAVENLTAIVEVELDNLFSRSDEFDEFSNNGKINLFQTLAYRMDDLRFGLNAAQYIYNVDNTDIALRFNPWVSYALADGAIVPRLDAVYIMGSGRNSGVYDRRGDVGGNALTYDNDDMVISVRPSIRFNIDSRTSLEIGNAFYYIDAGTLDGVINNVIYTDLVVRF